LLIFSSISLANSTALAQTVDDIVIGASWPITGSNSVAANDALAVVQAAIAEFNARGAVGGRKVKLLVLDDEFVPSKAASNARTLADQGVVALFNCWGTASCGATMAVSNESRLPLIAGVAGGGPMRTSPGRYAFNVRPTTEDEIQRMVTQMQTVGQNRIALVYQDDDFGKSGLVAYQAVMKRAMLVSVGEIPLALDGSNLNSVVSQLQSAKVTGVVLVASSKPTVTMITHARRSKLNVQFYNLAAQANADVVKELGPFTNGIVFTTLTPSPWRENVSSVKDYQRVVFAATGKSEYSYLGMEVYLNTRILLEGLLQAGPKVNRESLVGALETMGEKSFSTRMHVRFGPKDRNGSGFVGLTIIGRDGRFVE
jgi:ABC-type branched-subunit amino acid transport system substrate-binding protein